MIELVVNEVSFRNLRTGQQPAAPDVRTARLWMTDFVDCIRIATSNRWTKGIRTEEPFLNTELSPGYSLPQWRNDKEVNRDETVFFKRVATQSPYLEGAPEGAIDDSHRMEILFQGQSAHGLLATLLFNGVALNLKSSNVWSAPELPIEIHELTDMGVEVRQSKLRQVAVPEHWESHAEWLRGNRRAEIQNGADLIDKLPLLFDHIEICGDAPRQLRSFAGNERHFAWVVDCLFQADAECARWHSGSFPHHHLPGPATGESDTVHKNRELRSLRTFKTLAGKTLMFEHHMKNMSENIRIHYRLDEERRKLMIAYVGDHLPY